MAAVYALHDIGRMQVALTRDDRLIADCVHLHMLLPGDECRELLP
jgi:hypothetical protein